jgi:tetratricopeptide (TPR) repeat protein
MEELGFLALTISLAGSYVSVTPRLRSNIRLYLPEYRERRKQLLAQKPKRLVHRYGESVLTTWETTFNAISSKSPEASRLLTLLAFIHFDDIFVELFNCSIDSSADSVHLYMLETALQALESYSLVQWKPEQNSYSLHKLVHAWAHDRLDVQEQDTYVVVALKLLLNNTKNSERDPDGKSRLVPHLIANFGAISGLYKIRDFEDDTLLNLLEIESAFFDSMGRWTEAYAVERFIVDKQASLYGQEHPSTITAMNNLANTLGEQGQLEEAAAMMKEVLEKRRRILGEKHLDTISAMNSLANTLGDQGQLEEAASMIKEVLEKRRRILGEEHPSTISVMSNLANILGNQGQLEEAASMKKEVLVKRRRILGEEHPDTI